ncbi:MAG: hypothetical protein WA672_19390, partial [Candidatus Angelobacter sp.]
MVISHKTAKNQPQIKRAAPQRPPLYLFSTCLFYVQAALAALFLSAQRFFIISEMRFLAAALKCRRPRLPPPT